MNYWFDMVWYGMWVERERKREREFCNLSHVRSSFNIIINFISYHFYEFLKMLY